eukprot:SAG22_NODE_2088_length_3030_cov_7.531900_1_plen_94_part_00
MKFRFWFQVGKALSSPRAFARIELCCLRQCLSLPSVCFWFQDYVPAVPADQANQAQAKPASHRNLVRFFKEVSRTALSSLVLSLATAVELCCL